MSTAMETSKTTGEVRFALGNIVVPGVEGYFTHSSGGAFSHVHHCIPNNDGIGLKKRLRIGSVSNGTFGDGYYILPKANEHFQESVVEAIEKYIAKITG